MAENTSKFSVMAWPLWTVEQETIFQKLGQHAVSIFRIYYKISDLTSKTLLWEAYRTYFFQNFTKYLLQQEKHYIKVSKDFKTLILKKYQITQK